MDAGQTGEPPKIPFLDKFKAMQTNAAAQVAKEIKTSTQTETVTELSPRPLPPLVGIQQAMIGADRSNRRITRGQHVKGANSGISGD